MRQLEITVVLGQEIGGLGLQADAKSQEIELIQRELKGVRELWKKKLMPITKLTTLEREATRIEGERGKLISEIARVKAQMAETELQIIQIDQDLAMGHTAGTVRRHDGREVVGITRNVAALTEQG